MTDRRSKFYEQFQSNSLFSLEKVQEIKNFLVAYANNEVEVKNPEHRNWTYRYYIKNLGDSELVYYRSDNRKMVALEEVYDVINESHIRTKHGGRNIMIK